jgi:RNA polymerase sigma factor (sigma-70 family)
LATLAAPGVSATARSRPDVTDHDLVQAVRAGDDHAFERLYHRYHRRISAYIFGMVHDHGRAEDLTQEVFVSALRRMRQTDRPILFKPWIYEIAKNACIDQFRRTSRTEEVSIDAEDGHGLGPADHGKLHATGQSPDAAVEGKQELDHLCGAFGGLTDAHHQILVMRELEGLSYREIGERLGMSRPSVESTLFRARRRLTEEFEELRTGERCLRIQEIIGGAASGSLGTRDTRRVGSHISHCQPCRKHAVMAGLDAAVMARRPVRTRIAAFLPLPAFLKKRWFGGGDGSSSSDAVAAAAHHGPALAQVSMAAAQYGEPTMAGWMKATAVAAAVAVAGVGAGAADHVVAGGSKHHDAPIVQRGGAAAGSSSASAAAGSGAGATGGAQRAIVRPAGTSTGGGATSSAGRGGAGAASGAGAGGSGGKAGTFSGGDSGAGAGAAAGGSSAGGGSGAGASAASNGGGATGSGSGSSSSSSSAKGGSSSGSTSTTAASTATGATQTATHTTTGATGGIVGGAGAPQSGSSAPLVAPNLAPLTQAPAAAAPPQSAGEVVSGATDVVGDTVGGQVGGVVKQTGAVLGGTVDRVTTGVTDAAGKLLGGK